MKSSHSVSMTLALSFSLLLGAQTVVDAQEADTPPMFIRGDCNANGQTGEWITEALTIFGNRFLGLNSIKCLDACDSNDDGDVDISDAVYLLNFGFLGGPRPPAPYPSCGFDPRVLGRESDGLDCEEPPPACQPRSVCPTEAPDDLVELPFQRGDVQGAGSMNITSGVTVLNWLFNGGSPPDCLDAADMNDDGCVNMNDVLMMPGFCSMWLSFDSCPQLGPCEVDATEDFLGCRRSLCAE